MCSIYQEGQFSRLNEEVDELREANKEYENSAIIELRTAIEGKIDAIEMTGLNSVIEGQARLEKQVSDLLDALSKKPPFSPPENKIRKT